MLSKQIILFFFLILSSCWGWSQELQKAKSPARHQSGVKNIVWLEQKSPLIEGDLYEITITKYKDRSNVMLAIQSDDDFHVFNDKNLLLKSLNKTLKVSLDSLRPSLSSDTLKILLGPEADQLYYTFFQKVEDESVSNLAETTEPLTRTKALGQRDVLVILLIVFSILIVCLKVFFPKRFQDVFSLSRTFSLRPLEGDNLKARIFEQDGLLLTIIYTFSSAIVIYLYFENPEQNSFNQKIGFIIEFAKIWAAILALLIFKMTLIFAMSALYKNSKINTFYIKEILNISTFLVSLFIFITALMFLYDGQLPLFWWDFAKYLIIALYLVRLFLLYFKILKLSGFTNLYLFSYFCTTEIFPFVIGLKYFF